MSMGQLVIDLKVAPCTIGGIKMSQKHSLIRETPQRTPASSRSFLRPFNGQLTPFSKSPPRMESEMMDEMEEGGTVYGTNINIRQAMLEVEKFLVEFTEDDEPIYRNKLNEIEGKEEDPKNIAGHVLFEVDGRHLLAASKSLYLQFIYYPVQMISCFDQVLKDIYDKYFIQSQTDECTKIVKIEKKNRLMLGLNHLADADCTLIKQLNSTKIGRLIALRGIVIRASEIYPEIKAALFTCTRCLHTVEVELENARVSEPRQCPQCKMKDCMDIQHNLCSFTDKQYIKFQELPEFVTEGETPGAVTVLAYDSNVDGFRPGDRVEVIGIYRAVPSLVQRHRTQVRAIFNTYIDMISFSILEEKHNKITVNNHSFSDKQKQRFRKMADNPNIWDLLANSFAPSIFAHTEIKKGLLTQLFGGTHKRFQEAGRNRFRSDINICLLGDPSTAKSQLLQQVHKISSRSIYTSGRGSSAVGLTANVRKDPETKEFVLESGALVLSDLGICCIDEFDKMDEGSRTILLQAMQQQTISIAKAGIVCQLNSRTAILAAANPVNSKYDTQKSVVENIHLHPSLLSRFDLIFIILDLPNEQVDRSLASHILNLYSSLHPASKNPVKIGAFSTAELARYITYAREYIHPAITEAAGMALKEAYKEMRKIGMTRKTISATPRQLESLIRLSEAFAKMRLSQKVEEIDVKEAKKLIDEATLKSATDPSTGIVDMDIITTGKSSAIKMREEQITDRLRDLVVANASTFKNGISFDKLMQQLKKANKNKEEIRNGQLTSAMRMLQTQDLIILYGPDKSKPSLKYHRDTEM